MFLVSWTALLLSLSTLSSLILAQTQPPQDSWPHVYPGMPTGDYGPEWQNYFQVTKSLPNVTWPLGRNWAGNIPVNRPDHPNNTLFFWAFESSEGSFTANGTDPWGIWLDGGPGGSSLWGLLFESGPILISSNYSVSENQYAWTGVADIVWIDSPVGTGFSTVDPDGYVADEEQLASDFMEFLENFVKVFPNLATRPVYLMGESYAGMYIPYITKAYFGMENPPVTIGGMAIGNGALSAYEEITQVPVISVLETYPQIIGYDPEVFEYFSEQHSLCGYNLTLQYPQPEHFPTLNAPLPTHFPVIPNGPYGARLTQKWIMQEIQDRSATRHRERDNPPFGTNNRSARLEARDAWKRGFAGRPNGTIDPWYLCDLWFEMMDYAINYTYPWSLCPLFDPYDIPDALSPQALSDASVFLNDNRTRAALHAPTSKDWVGFISPVFASTNGSINLWGDPSVEPMAFLSDLASNMTSHNMTMILFSGNDDSLVPHFGSELTIQNTTFGGIQGFTRKPKTPWYDDAGEFAGIVHQERGWKYVLVDHASHLLGYSNPVSALTFVREFVFGNNQTGLVTNSSSGSVSVIGGEASSLGGILMGQAAIYYGSATTESSYFFPTATVEEWNSYIATAAATCEACSE